MAQTLLSPRVIGATLLMLVAVAAAGWLGFWQVQAWQEQRDDETADLTDREPVPLSDVLGPDDPFPADSVGAPVSFTGEWVPDATVYVEGRVQRIDDAETEGFWVVTPLQVGESALPVVRGWSPTVEDAPAPPTGVAEVSGWLQPPEGTGAIDEDPRDDVYPQLRSADLAQRLDTDIYGAYAIAQVPTGGLVAADLAATPEPSRSTGLRNLLYGIEWWVFGAFALYVWQRFVRDELAADVSHAGASESTPAE